tara:strand:+ start:1303 stop:2463 length:1161 start_codon:yes stop_codon:yes gene_type:complete
MKTPYYSYNLNLLERTLQDLIFEAKNYKIHYAIKANNDIQINKIIAKFGLGADCVSGNEILHALKCGFSNNKIVFAGIGKSDEEIEIALNNNIACFNVESLQELKVINYVAKRLNKKTSVALRINPNINVDTHQYIKTGINENKFGISFNQILKAIEIIDSCHFISLTGLHFHIGSQITNLRNFEYLAKKVNFILNYIEEKGIKIKHINLGGGLGIDYDSPYENSIPNFKKYFNVFKKHLTTKPYHTVHFELGRSIVGQCGDLITTVLYIKKGISKKFAIVDAGMTDLIRPALYQAKHLVVKCKTEFNEIEKYDIVGPICESSDKFISNYSIEKLKRGDQLKIKSVGAYGQVMVSEYNLRTKPGVFYHGEKLHFETRNSTKKLILN